jgi:thiol-disulfide isomerase/thioredoxin
MPHTQPHTFFDLPDTGAKLLRRDLLAAAALLAAPSWSAAAAKAARGKPMTATEEADAARAVAEYKADQAREPVHPAIGRMPRLPATLPLLDGRTYTEADARGKLLLVFYWASWCPICKLVEPRLHNFWLKNRARGLELLTVSTDGHPQPALAHLRRTGYQYPAAMAASLHWDAALAPRSLPTLLVRSKLGVVVDSEEGDIDASELKDLLVHLRSD